MPTSHHPHCVALIPAAGTGKRLGGTTPKQYQKLGKLPMLVHTVKALQAHPAVREVYVVLAPDDTFYNTLCAPYLQACTPLYVGADTRAGSVYAGLQALSALSFTEQNPWILVHDAARPCLHADDLHALIQACEDQPDYVGHVLSNPVADTLKRITPPGTQVLETVSREALWQAQTPQAARLFQLREALEYALHTRAEPPTDEAQALEWQNLPVQLVKANHPNFKVTYPADQQLAEAVLSRNSTHKNF